MADAREGAAFMRGWSLEAAHPTEAEIQGLRGLVPPGTQVYIPAVPHQPAARIVDAAVKLRAAGFEPVPHIAARDYVDVVQLEDVLRQAGARRALIIAGDRDRPAGPFGDALAIIESGLLQRHGIMQIGISGYPDGHPRIAPATLERAMVEKLGAAGRAGLPASIVTQFCFAPERILAWLRRLRAMGIEVPVRIGMAGPTSIAGLLRYAKRCGVRASARGFARHAGSLCALAGHATPDDLLIALGEAHARGGLGDVAPHFFSFGGIVATASYARAAAAGWPD
jgi:methylenetetrahydrofolate reductase (NADPH)